VLDCNGFKARLREARIKAGISIPMVVRHLDVPHKRVYGWEGIGELPTLDEFTSLCEYYNADPKWIMFGNKTADAEKG
jgi:hypothetical protein